MAQNRLVLKPETVTAPQRRRRSSSPTLCPCRGVFHGL